MNGLLRTRDLVIMVVETTTVGTIPVVAGVDEAEVVKTVAIEAAIGVVVVEVAVAVVVASTTIALLTTSSPSLVQEVPMKTLSLLLEDIKIRPTRDQWVVDKPPLGKICRTITRCKVLRNVSLRRAGLNTRTRMRTRSEELSPGTAIGVTSSEHVDKPEHCCRVW